MAKPEVAIDAVDYETALGDPAAYYADPEAVFADHDITDGQKYRFLSEWRLDLLGKQEADNEGMAPPGTTESAGEAELVKRIDASLARLKDAEQSDARGKRSFWQRVFSS